MGWPYDADLETIVPGKTTAKASWAKGVMDVIKSISNGTRNLFGLVLSDSEGTTTRPGSGMGKPFIYLPDVPTVRRLVSQWQIGIGVYARRYQLLNGGEEVTFNAAWNPGTLQWSLDDAGKVAMCFRHLQTNTVATTYQMKKDAASGAWADSSWDEVFRVDRSGGVYATDLIAHGSVQIDGGGSYVITTKFTAGPITTTDATPTHILSYTPPTNSVSRVTMKVNGIRSDHAAGACYWKTFTMLNNAGTPANVGGGGADVVAAAEDDAAWDFSSPGFLGAVFLANVTGKAATTIKWTADIEIITVLS